MNTIRVKTTDFDLVGLIHSSLSCREVADYGNSVCWGNMSDLGFLRFLADADNGCEVMDPKFKVENTLKYLKENGNFVFVGFSGTINLEEIPCIDGHEYVGIYENGEEIFYGTETEYETHMVGYLITLEGNYLVIEGAEFLTNGGGMYPFQEEHLNLTSDCGMFDEPMEEYLNNFM